MKQELREELSRLSAVPEASARAYHGNLTYLVDRVNRKLASREDIESLIGGNPLHIMFDNHRNHAVFMDNVLQLSFFPLLLDTVPWVYRSYRNHGFSPDYFPVQLQAWKEALEEVLVPETSQPLQRVYDWMLSRHGDFVALAEEIPETDVSSPLRENGAADGFLQALLRGDREAVVRISREGASAPRDLEPFYQDVVRPAMYRIGELWEQGRISVSREHLASALANTAVSSQYVRIMPGIDSWKGRVVVTAAPNEFHVLGAQMIANCLEAEGWEVDFLGADIPSEDLVASIRENPPDVLALSVTMTFNLVQAKDMVDRIGNALQGSRPRVLLGGLALARYPELVERIGADGYAEDCARAVELVEQWCGEGTHGDDADR